jgi:queuine tRNA-ribosyltransferase
MHFAFTLLQTDEGSRARLGRITTPHGPIDTPAFAPVGTQATVKALDPRDLDELDAALILANTYHLYLRPGAEVVAEMGGLHRFMGWPGPILTDSGGFQVFSLAENREVGDDGVVFRSHIDGSRHEFTPEAVVGIQELLGADIIMVLDECAAPYDRAYNEAALARTHAWAKRCQAAQTRDDQALFGIVQGGVFADLRRESARFLTGLDFPGYAIGGLSVGESKAEMYGMLDVTAPLLPADKPRRICWRGWPGGWICSTACCPRGWPATRRSLPGRGGSTCATPGSRGTRRRWRPAAVVTPARPFRGPTCGTCSRPGRCWAPAWQRSTTCTFCCN